MKWSRTPRSLPPLPTMSSACLLPMENFGLRISLIREVRIVENNGKQLKEINYMMIRLHPGREPPRFPRTGLREIGMNGLWKWRLTGPKQPGWCRPDPRWPVWRWLSDLTMLWWHVAPSPLLSIKALAPQLVVVVVGSWPLHRRQPPFPQVASIWNKAKFPFCHLACL